jgi:Flp pilus assembly pilin Flp
MKKLNLNLALNTVVRDTRGQDMAEYALLAGFVALAVMTGFPPVENSISTIFSKLSSLLVDAGA